MFVQAGIGIMGETSNDRNNGAQKPSIDRDLVAQSKAIELTVGSVDIPLNVNRWPVLIKPASHHTYH
jgi:hypothetical protein